MVCGPSSWPTETAGGSRGIWMTNVAKTTGWSNGWNFRNEKDKCLIKVCVCVCFCHVDVVYVPVFMLETNTSTCCECFFHTVIVFWGTMLLFLAVLNCLETLPQDPYSAKVAAGHIPSQIPTNYALGRSFETVLKLNQICSNTVVIIKDTKGSAFILNSPRSSFLSVRQQLRINAGGMPRMNRAKFILLLPLQNQSMR